jgi:hypothetical protein
MGYFSDIRYTAEKLKSELADRARSNGTDAIIENVRKETYDEWISSGTEEILLERILLERSDFQVRLADTRGRRNKSSLLINRMYSWRGYKRSTSIDPSQDVNRITLQACHADSVFGTLTVAFDSASGLAADALYKAEIDWFRNSGSIVCELTRLAVDPKDGSKEVLGTLFHLAYIYGGLLRGATDVFIEVNPRHVSFYKRMLDFEQAGECKMCARVDAPAVLLHLEVGYVAEQIARYGGHRGRGKRSLYPYFFSKQEEAGLTRRIARLAR